MVKKEKTGRMLCVNSEMIVKIETRQTNKQAIVPSFNVQFLYEYIPTPRKITESKKINRLKYIKKPPWNEVTSMNKNTGYKLKQQISNILAKIFFFLKT